MWTKNAGTLSYLLITQFCYCTSSGQTQWKDRGGGGVSNETSSTGKEGCHPSAFCYCCSPCCHYHRINWDYGMKEQRGKKHNFHIHTKLRSYFSHSLSQKNSSLLLDLSLSKPKGLLVAIKLCSSSGSGMLEGKNTVNSLPV